MKKKLTIFVMALLIFPILALVGCGAKDSYSVEVNSSWTGILTGTRGGTVSGSGSYKEGSSVTLTATAKPESSFIAWVYEDSVLITGGSGYSIDNRRSTNDKISESKLTFKANSKTKGKYTAVFDDNKMVYTKLTAWRVTDDYSLPAESDETLAQEVLTTNLYISQGNVNSDIYSAEGLSFLNNVNNKTNKVKDILKLSAEEAQDLVVDFSLIRDGSTVYSNLLRAEIEFGESVDKFSDATNPYKVNYTENGTYEIIFKIAFGQEEKYLVIEYSNLNSFAIF